MDLTLIGVIVLVIAGVLVVAGIIFIAYGIKLEKDAEQVSGLDAATPPPPTLASVLKDIVTHLATALAEALKNFFAPDKKAYEKLQSGGVLLIMLGIFFALGGLAVLIIGVLGSGGDGGSDTPDPSTTPSGSVAPTT